MPQSSARRPAPVLIGMPPRTWRHRAGRAYALPDVAEPTPVRAGLASAR